MHTRRLQVLTDRDHVTPDGSQVGTNVHHFVDRFAETEHDAALGRHVRVFFFDLSEQVERYLNGYFASFGKDLPPPGLYERVIRQVELPLLTAALAATRGNQIRAAELLGLNRNTLRSRIRSLDIRVFRTPQP